MIFLPFGRRSLLSLCGIVLLLCLTVSKVGYGEPTEKLQAEISELEQRASTLNIRYTTQAASKEQIAEHRLVDAQVLYNLKDYTRAAILLLDFVTNYKGTRGYPEALYFLADSLYHKRDFMSAKRYFRIIAKEVKGRYYQEALQRLVELSMRTGDYSDIEEHLAALNNIPPSALKPSVPYILGKYYYFRKDYPKAIATFRGIPQGQKYFMHASYFIGAALIRQKKNNEAEVQFKSITNVKPKNKSEEHIKDLASLAVGRLLYERGEVVKAIDYYQKVSRTSEEFDTALYEIAWAYIKAKQHEQALRSLELLVLAHPDSPLMPQVKVIQGNLLIRLKDWGQATKLFTETREKFVPVHNRMTQVMAEHSDPNVFFDALLSTELKEEQTPTVQIPQLAKLWVKENTTVKRGLNLVEDVREIEESVDEANKLIVRLERAVNSPAKIKIFPEFASAKGSALEIENRLLLARQKILESERTLVASVMSDGERSELDSLASQRVAYEEKIKDLPQTVEEFERRQHSQMERLDGLEKVLSQLSVDVDSLQAQLVAAEKFFQDTNQGKDKSVKRSFEKETNDIRIMIVGLQTESEEIMQAVQDLKNSFGVGGVEEIAERQVKKQYQDNLSKEHAFLTSLRSRLSGAQGGEFDTLSNLLGRCDSITKVLDSFDKQLEAGVEGKLAGIRTAIEEEKKQVERYGFEIGDYKTHTDRVAGGIIYQGFQNVAKRFYEIIVRADVGIIDVAWALKDAKSKEVSRLVQEQKMELKMLDAEFKEVLETD